MRESISIDPERRGAKTMTKILLFGAGAIGGVYVYTFLQAGCSVTAVLRSNYHAVKRDGFQMYSVRFGNVHFQPTVVRNAEEAASSGPWDFIVVCSKAFPGSRPSLPDQIRPTVGALTAIVLIQNGIDIEAEVAEAFPGNPIISTVVYLPTTQIRPGVIDYGASQNETLNLLEIGTYPASAPRAHKAAAEQLARLVVKGGGEAKVHGDVQPARWSKLIVNASFNPITALSLSNDADFIRSSPYSVKLIRGVMYEVVSIAEALGVDGISREVADRQLMRLEKRTVGKAPSMLVDVQEDRPFEVEVIVGNTVRIAERLGVKVPLLEALYALAKGLLVSMENTRTAQKPQVDGV